MRDSGDNKKDKIRQSNNRTFGSTWQLGIDKITALLNEIFDTGQFHWTSPDLYIYSTAKEIRGKRVIILISYIIKILLRIIMMRVKHQSKPEIEKLCEMSSRSFEQ